jgi:hypothetical protein
LIGLIEPVQDVNRSKLLLHDVPQQLLECHVSAKIFLHNRKRLALGKSKEFESKPKFKN